MHATETMSWYGDGIGRLVVLESRLGLESIIAGLGLGLAYQGLGLELGLSHPKIESLFKSAYSCNAVAAPHTSQDLHSYFVKDQTIKAP